MFDSFSERNERERRKRNKNQLPLETAIIAARTIEFSANEFRMTHIELVRTSHSIFSLLFLEFPLNKNSETMN